MAHGAKKEKKEKSFNLGRHPHLIDKKRIT
jgi:hypothetical protein